MSNWFARKARRIKINLSGINQRQKIFFKNIILESLQNKLKVRVNYLE